MSVKNVVAKIFLTGIFCVLVVAAFAIFSQNDFSARAAGTLTNTQPCDLLHPEQCVSGYCAPDGKMCCNSNQCGYGEDKLYPRQCLDIGQERDTTWPGDHQEGVCVNVNGVAKWLTRSGGYNCVVWPCVSGSTCNTNANRCSGTLSAPRKDSNTQYCGSGNDCQSGFCSPYQKMCCANSSQCGWGDGALYSPRQCFDNNASDNNITGSGFFICRAGVWKTQAGKTGCNIWPCDSGTCVNNVCTCTPSCAGKSCGADNGCGSPCQTGACSTGYTCSNGQCVAGCTNACTSGLKQCSGDGYQTCGDSNGDGCTEWSTVTACPGGQTCSSGVCSSTCSNDCSTSGATQCSGSGYQACGKDYDSDSCLEWSSVTACPTGQTCSSGSCGGCVSHSTKKCVEGNLYWYNSCGAKEELFQNCGANSLTSNYRCGGVWLQRETIVKDCVNGACVQESSWSNITNCSLTGKVCKNSVCVAGDTQAPVLSGLAPSGTLYDSSVTLTVTTSEAADCRYSWYDKNFDAMTLKFQTSAGKYHSTSIILPNYNNYNYYVRCRDSAGNINPVAGRIIFRYASMEPVVTAPPADTKPPTISDLTPSGDINTVVAALSVSTDENATCKYDAVDTVYDSMENTMNGSDTVSHSKNITLSAAGTYAYYVRCADDAGNKNKTSAQINFNYVLPKEGPVISNPMPTGTVYQSSVSLMVLADKTADCRYSTSDSDYDLMQNSFSTSDGRQQTATVALSDYGPYTYFVRCKDIDGNTDSGSALISFEYANPDQNENQSAQPPVAKPVSCDEYKSGASDGVCDNTPDCICDLDCGANGQPEDSDCAGVAAEATGTTNVTAIAILISLVIIVVAVAAIAMMKKKKNADDNQETEESL